MTKEERGGLDGRRGLVCRASQARWDSLSLQQRATVRDPHRQLQHSNSGLLTAHAPRKALIALVTPR